MPEWKHLDESDYDCENFMGSSNSITKRGARTSQEFLPPVDLYNFDNSEFRDTKYVLTSPRSLEACARHQVKPAELLYKSLQEYQDELYPEGYATRSVYTIYDEKEALRQKKLKICRDERERIILEEARKLSKKTKEQYSPYFSRKSTYSKQQISDSEESDLGIGSLQRRRTAWTTSVGHGRVTQDEINKRAQELLNEHKYPRTCSESYAELKRKKSSRRKSSTLPGSRPMSPSELGITVSSPWRYRASSVDSACPIKNRKLRKELNASKSYVTKKDQKLLETMVAKHEQERVQLTSRNTARRLWEEERKKRIYNKISSENQRRAALAEERREKELERLDKEELRKIHASAIRAEREAAVALNDYKREELQSRLQTDREMKILNKQKKDMVRKKSQENMKILHEKQNEEFRDFVNSKHQYDVLRVNLKKSQNVSQEQMRRKKTNESERLSHLRRHDEVEKQNQRANQEMRISIDLKHAIHENKFGEILENTERHKQLSQRERENKLRNTREMQELMEAEMAEWRKDVKLHRQLSESRAKFKSEENLRKISRKAIDERTRKEITQKLNLLHIQQEEMDWKRGTIGSIAYKKAKTRSMQQEKDYYVKTIRKNAAEAQKLRDEVKKRYETDSFDKKVQRVQLENRIGSGYNSATKNLSTVTIA